MIDVQLKKVVANLLHTPQCSSSHRQQQLAGMTIFLFQRLPKTVNLIMKENWYDFIL